LSNIYGIEAADVVGGTLFTRHELLLRPSRPNVLELRRHGRRPAISRDQRQGPRFLRDSIEHCSELGRGAQAPYRRSNRLIKSYINATAVAIPNGSLGSCPGRLVATILEAAESDRSSLTA